MRPARCGGRLATSHVLRIGRGPCTTLSLPHACWLCLDCAHQPQVASLTPTPTPNPNPTRLPQFKKGDKVFALTPGFYNATQEGCYAEYVAAEADWVARVPDNLPLEQVPFVGRSTCGVCCRSALVCGLVWSAGGWRAFPATYP